MTLTEVIVVIIVIAILIGVLLPQIARVKFEARQSLLKNNMRQMALGFLNYESSHECFPKANFDFPEHGTQYSWATEVLVFMEAGNYYESIDRRFPHDHLLNSYALSSTIPSYMNPHENILYNSKGQGLIHFSANPYVTVEEGEPMRLSDLEEGSNSVELFGEVYDGYRAWGAPGNTRPMSSGINFDASSYGSPANQGCHFANADGSVKFVASTTERPANRIQQPYVHPPRLPADTQTIDHLMFRNYGLNGPNRKSMLEFVPESILNSKGGYGLKWGPAISDLDLANLAKIKYVAGVGISSYNNISNDGVRHLAAMPQLQLLKLLGFEISDEGLAHLEQSASLKVLNIKPGSFSREALERFKAARPDCEVIIEESTE